MRRRTVDTVTLERQASSFVERRFGNASRMAAFRLALSMLDLTTLEGKDTSEKVRSLCRKGITPYHGPIDPPLPSVAAICVYPALVPIARAALAESSVKVASVAAAFPSGQSSLDVRLAEVRRAVQDGADEIDIVINRGSFLEGHRDAVADEIKQFAKACGHARLKIILETGELETYDDIRLASDLSIDAACSVIDGGDIAHGRIFLKTSTGKTSPSATLPVVLTMLQAIRDHERVTGTCVGIKPAGGIRTAAQTLPYLAMVSETLDERWLTPDLCRFGASSLADDLVHQLVRAETRLDPAAYD
jgi:deoxyribose-phosphate aldolase